jgi:hypothetical protein
MFHKYLCDSIFTENNARAFIIKYIIHFLILNKTPNLKPTTTLLEKPKAGIPEIPYTIDRDPKAQITHINR